jgi:hypothetical protein
MIDAALSAVRGAAPLRRVVLAAGLLAWLAPRDVAAQTSADAGALAPTGATAPLESQALGVGPSPWGLSLREADRARLDAGRTQAWTLFAWGTVNVLEGAGLLAPFGAPASVERDRLTAYGAMTASWGAVNVALSLPWILSLRRERSALERWTALSAVELDAALDRRREESAREASIFALMCGLDVTYASVGGLLLAMGERAEARNPMLSGFGIALIAQGVSLLALDSWYWASRAAQSRRWAELDRARRSAR